MNPEQAAPDARPRQMRGIYLVANAQSELLAENLVFSIRRSGCTLPIRLIPYGGPEVSNRNLLGQVEIVEPSAFGPAASAFVNEVMTVVRCPEGYIRRFLPWFGDWDEFLYSDNDIVALMNWERMFSFLPENDIVHADLEYSTGGRYTHHKPRQVEANFGPTAMQSLFTAGHFVARRRSVLVEDMREALNWFRHNPGVPMLHDMALLHIASLIGRWHILNLCRSPYNWISSWAGDYKNPLDLMLQIQTGAPASRCISHLHYSGLPRYRDEPIGELLNASLSPRERAYQVLKGLLAEVTGLRYALSKVKRYRNGFTRRYRSFMHG
jgi:hypothetical protein